MELRKFARLIKKLVLLALIFFLAIYLLVSLQGPDQLIERFGFKPFVVMSNSMDPVFRRGDVLIVKKTAIKDFNKGDILAGVRRDGVYISHYIADIYQIDGISYFKTRKEGASQRADWDAQALSEDQVLGRVSLVIPYIGNVVLFLTSPIGMVTSLLAILVIILIFRKTRGGGA